jgi:hypothetical protein
MLFLEELSVLNENDKGSARSPPLQPCPRPPTWLFFHPFVMPSFYDLLQAVSKLSFHPSTSSSREDGPLLSSPSPPLPRPHLPIAEAFARRLDHTPPRRSPLPPSTLRHDRAARPDSLLSLSSLAAGSVVSPEDAALLKEISVLLKQRWERGYGPGGGEEGEEESFSVSSSAPVRRVPPSAS